MCLEKMIFEKRPIKVLLFAKSPKNFMVAKGDLENSFSCQ